MLFEVAVSFVSSLIRQVYFSPVGYRNETVTLPLLLSIVT